MCNTITSFIRFVYFCVGVFCVDLKIYIGLLSLGVDPQHVLRKEIFPKTKDLQPIQRTVLIDDEQKPESVISEIVTVQSVTDQESMPDETNVISELDPVTLNLASTTNGFQTIGDEADVSAASTDEGKTFCC